MELISILVFIIYLFGLGYSLIRILGLRQSSRLTLEFFVISLGCGLALIPILGTIFGLLRIPIFWVIFLILSLVIPVFDLCKHKPRLRFKFTKSSIYSILAVVILIFVFVMYAKGAFSYAWLGDGDPWVHVMSVRYVADEKTIFVEAGKETVFRYLDPYPPGFAITMGLLYQTSQNLIWSLKFFNIAIITLGYWFMYYFFRRFVKNSKKALFGLFTLAMIPAFVSRFVWAHSIVIALLPVFLFALLMIKKNKNWFWVAGLVLGSTMLTQPTQPIKFVALFVLLAVVSLFVNRKLWKVYVGVLIVAGIVALLWWGPMMFKYGNIVNAMLGRTDGMVFAQGTQGSRPYFGALGSATRMYYFNDFFIAKGQNLITNPVGWGIFPTLLLVLGLFYVFAFKPKLLKPKKGSWQLTSLLWFVFTFVALFGGTLYPVALFSFRFWTLVSIPLSLFAAEGLWLLFKLGKKVNVPMFLILLVVVVGVFGTAGYQKFQLNANAWGPENAHVKYSQMDAYLWLDTLPKWTDFFYLCHRRKFGDHTILAYDMDVCTWCDEEISFRKDIYDSNGFNITAREIRSWMNEHDYDYLMVEGNCIDYLAPEIRDLQNISREDADAIAANSTSVLIQEIVSSGLFTPVHQTKGSVILK